MSLNALKQGFAAALSADLTCWVVHCNGATDDWPPGLNPAESCECFIDPAMPRVLCVAGDHDDWKRVRPLVAAAGQWWRKRIGAGPGNNVELWLAALAERTVLDRHTWVGRSLMRLDLLNKLRRRELADPLGLLERFAQAGDPPRWFARFGLVTACLDLLDCRPADRAKAAGKARRGRRQWVATAKELLISNPTLTDKEIAALCQVAPSTVSRCRRFQAFRLDLEARLRRTPKRGVIVAQDDAFTVDAAVPPADELDV